MDKWNSASQETRSQTVVPTSLQRPACNILAEAVVIDHVPKPTGVQDHCWMSRVGLCVFNIDAWCSQTVKADGQSFLYAELLI